MEGWIKLHRSFLDHWLCDEYRPLTKQEAWIRMLFTVNYESKKALIHGQLIDCNRGQSILSIESWAGKFVWSTGQVRHFFKLLENDKMIKVEGLKYTTRLTICNYDKYQDVQQTDDKLTTNSIQTDDKLTTTTKESKESKEIKNISTDFILPDLYFKNIVDQWLKFRKELKKPYKTQKGIEQFYAELKKLSENNVIKAQAIINQSIANEWQGIFQLKNNNTQNNTHKVLKPLSSKKL